MISFQYISLIDQLKALCKSEAFCHDFLGMWRERERWLDKDPSHYPEFIHEFWDGEKTRLCQDFWNPDASWEAPIHCSNQYCKMTYKAFPQKHPKLLSGWKEDLQEYEFKCARCMQPIQAKRTLVQVVLHFEFHLRIFKASRYSIQ